MRLKQRVAELEFALKRQDCQRKNDMVHCETLIKSLEEKVEKQEEAIKGLVELFRPMIVEQLSSALGKINDLLEKELKDLFNTKDTTKTEKVRKPRAKKVEKVDEPKTEKKSKKKDNTK